MKILSQTVTRPEDIETKVVKSTRRVHRVGTITAGCALVLYGILFVVHQVFEAVSYRFIFDLWPCILIGIGCEMLISTMQKEDEPVIYDKGAVFLVMILMFFAMGMALIDMLIKNSAALCL